MGKVNAVGLMLLLASVPAATADEPVKAKHSPKPAVSAQLSFSVEAYDPAKPSSAAIKCVVRNDGPAGFHVPVGFDGGYVQLRGDQVTLAKPSRGKDDVKLAWVGPRQEQVVFELPLDDLFLVAKADRPAWRWDWVRQAEPPLSPVHKWRKPGFVTEATFTVSLDLGGSVLKSEPAVLKVKDQDGK